jgi:hypothetical protein
MTDFAQRSKGKIQWTPIAAGPRGTRQTLEVMANLARQGSGLLSVKAVAYGLAEIMRVGGMAAVDEWLRAHYRFRPEWEEVLRTMERMMEDLDTLGYFEGDCDDAAIFYASILYTLGIPCRFVAIRYNPANPEFEHVFVEYNAHIFDEGYHASWSRLDPTVPPGTVHRELERMIHDV